MYNFDDLFPKYKEYDPKVPVWCLTPQHGCYTHRFFDTCPISPSGRYLAVLDMPYENKYAEFGDEAGIVVVDLYTGLQREVYKTKGWQHQLGANINWGASDDELIFNDIDCEAIKPFAVRLNQFTGECKKLDHEIYHVSPDGRYGVSSNLMGTIATQYGYGITVPSGKIPENTILSEDDGVWVTDIQTGKSNMILSLKDIYKRTHTQLERSHLLDGLCYVFHTKWSPNGKKIMFSTRYKKKGYKDVMDCNGKKNSLLYCIFTCNPDGGELEVSIDETQWVKGGHHTTWAPDSSYLTMNLNIENEGLRLCKASLKGRHIEKLIEDAAGSGHPSLHKSKNLIITDTYESDPLAYRDGTVPIRLIDLDKRQEFEPPIRINIGFPERSSAGLRVDPHVVWDRTGRYCIFNGHVEGCRRVFIADMSRYVGE